MLSKNMDSEEKLRQEAVPLYLQDVSVSSVATKLSKSRQWIYKWVSRYENSSDLQWYREYSRASLKQSVELPADIEHAIIETRKRLKGFQL
ncbi:MAG: helix-turn-helix domain-containing protein [Prevotellaceae bacterium]|nr:helix-turn-helix domain-containing protein [Prevotellaceae bacterium]